LRECIAGYYQLQLIELYREQAPLPDEPDSTDDDLPF
jgi:hypothetical protein